MTLGLLLKTLRQVENKSKKGAAKEGWFCGF